jgi:hypothetical protein
MTDPDVYTIKWKELPDKEKMLERIMLQKWIGSYTNGEEVWSDHRRTDYPKLAFNRKNDSNETLGLIGPEEFIKRTRFVLAERNNNAAGVVEATKKLGGANLVSTRLWIHPAGPNFP